MHLQNTKIHYLSLRAKRTLKEFRHFFRSNFFSSHFSCSTHFREHFGPWDGPTLDLGQNLACAFLNYKFTTLIENHGKCPLIWYVVCLYWRQIRFGKWLLKIGAYGRVPRRHQKISTCQIACYGPQSEFLSSCWLCPSLVPPHHNFFFLSLFRASVFATVIDRLNSFTTHFGLPAAILILQFVNLLDMRGSKFSQTRRPGQQENKCLPLWGTTSIWRNNRYCLSFFFRGAGLSLASDRPPTEMASQQWIWISYAVICGFLSPFPPPRKIVKEGLIYRAQF